jgi:hypothetical protein
MPKRARESFSSSPSASKRVRVGQANRRPQFLGLESAGLEPVQIEGDGACFFRAVADQLYSNQNEHLHIRESAVYYILNRRLEFQPFLAPEAQPTRSCRKSNCNSPNISPENSKELFVQHLRRMLQPCEWATHLEVQATASCFGLEIHIYRPDQEMAQLIVGNREGQEGQMRRIDICFDHNAQHYWSTQPVLNEGNAVEQVMLMEYFSVVQEMLNDPEAEDDQAHFLEVWTDVSRFLSSER